MKKLDLTKVREREILLLKGIMNISAVEYIDLNSVEISKTDSSTYIKFNGEPFSGPVEGNAFQNNEYFTVNLISDRTKLTTHLIKIDNNVAIKIDEMDGNINNKSFYRLGNFASFDDLIHRTKPNFNKFKFTSITSR